MNYLIIIPLVLSFLITFILLPVWMKKAQKIGLIWEDMNKSYKIKVPGSGGIIVLGSWTISMLLLVAYKVFFLNSTIYLIEIFAIISIIIMLSGIGLIDDLLGWRSGGLSMRSRLIMVALASIPLIAINAGRHTISLPFLGQLNLGLFYPLILIPIGIVGATTTFNFLAGFNGLEAGQGIILLTALSIVSYFTGSPIISFILLSMVAASLAFLIYNFTPAKIFPGDSLTYAIGGLIAISAILGNFEKIAIFFFIPYILEVTLKLRGNLKKQSFGLPQKDGSLKMKYDKIYGLEHLSIYSMEKMGIKPTEKKVVYSIWAFQIIIVVLGFLIFGNGVFK